VHTVPHTVTTGSGDANTKIFAVEVARDDRVDPHINLEANFNGSGTSRGRRGDVVRACAAHGVKLIEDATIRSVTGALAFGLSRPRPRSHHPSILHWQEVKVLL
jgi:hypothetical protein